VRHGEVDAIVDGAYAAGAGLRRDLLGGLGCQTMGRISDILKSSPHSSLSLSLSLRILTVLAMMVRPLPALRESMLVYLGSVPASSIPVSLGQFFPRPLFFKRFGAYPHVFKGRISAQRDFLRLLKIKGVHRLFRVLGESSGACGD
jgi:hypothetical protein